MAKAYFSIINGDCNQFAVFPEEYQNNGSNISLSISHRIDTAVADRAVRMVVFITARQEERTLLKAECSLEFKFEEESFKELRKADVYEVPVDVVRHFGALTYGAMRGVLIAKKANISFPMPVLPGLDITRLITEPLLISA